jgi:hypothetical protein
MIESRRRACHAAQKQNETQAERDAGGNRIQEKRDLEIERFLAVLIDKNRLIFLHLPHDEGADKMAERHTDKRTQRRQMTPHRIVFFLRTQWHWVNE